MSTKIDATANVIKNVDDIYMRRCIQLALNAEGRTFPNPMVGAVVVYDGRIIGEGWHHKAGEPHAEVNAINSVKDQALLPKSTIYVSLEPCAHQGRTPPCADLIIRKNIKRVVVGCRDSFAQVNGRGIQKLLDAGIEVTEGVLKEECRWLNRRFFTVQEKKRPYVILKWAESADGFMGAIRDGKPAPVAISNQTCLRMVHKQRTTEDGILVGAGTVDSDDPMLSARLWTGNQPLRYVVDPSLRLPKTKKIYNGAQPTIIFNRIIEVESLNVRYVSINLDPGEGVESILRKAYEIGTQSIIVEGGSRTLQSFIDAGIWDEAFVYVSDRELSSGVKAPQLSGCLDNVQHIEDCQLRHYVGSSNIFIDSFESTNLT